VPVVARFEVGYTQFLDQGGEIVQPLPDFAREPGNLIPLYRNMVLTRTYDARAVALQRTGQLGTFASSLGQEAVGTAVGAAMRPEDVLFPTRDSLLPRWIMVAGYFFRVVFFVVLGAFGVTVSEYSYCPALPASVWNMTFMSTLPSG